MNCPLCQKELVLNTFFYEREMLPRVDSDWRNLFTYQCPICSFCVEPSETEEEALRNAEKLISKFPPIMRISPGDRLAYDGWICVVTSIDREKCTIDVVSTNPAEPFDPGIEDFTPPIDGAEITPDFVDAWPWKLKQEEGAKR